MTNVRRLAVTVLGAVWLSAPLVRSQDLKVSEAKTTVIQPLPIQAPRLQPGQALDGLRQMVPVAAPALSALDLSSYRGFQFGETLPAVAKQAGLEISAAKLIHERPAVIQELEWPIWLSGDSSRRTDPVKTILFSFYNGELFRITVIYDRNETAGLTTGDMIEAISAKYGTATKPANTEIAFSSAQGYNDSEAVTARWQDAQYSFNLFLSSSYSQPTFGMVAFSKRLDALARAATTEAIRLDAQEAPQREIQRQNTEDKTNRETLEKARQVNKQNFRL